MALIAQGAVPRTVEAMANRLAESTSPYLLQHQDNPVDWWEWGEDAFEEARRRDVPVLLSVGYAACHWCHVMAHESFENMETAAVMNERFVNIKVDREERPDVDSVYMEAVQAMTGQGGWPMTVWMDHDGRPFFAGTYFPDRPRHGMASFGQVMDAVSSAWEERREDVSKQAQRLVGAIAGELASAALPGPESLGTAYRQIAAGHDPVDGGFGGAPKFPQQPVLEFLLRIHDETWAPEASAMLDVTLERMAAGGIHDHLGGGFARYSVDGHWLVPHFEKMLYDNAQLARIYLWAGVELEQPDFLSVARSTIEYMVRDLRHDSGGFFSSEDADSEGEEGKFYVWTPDQIREVIGDDTAGLLEYFGVTDEGNFEGANILHLSGAPAPEGLAEARQALFEAREERVRPALDDKVVTAWNGLAIRALAEAGAVTGDERFLDLARQAASFVKDMLVVDGALMRSWRAGRTSVPGFLDDHAALAVGLFSLYAATAEEEWYQQAIGLVDALSRFRRPDGGFYATGSGSAGLVKRPMDFTDNPLPSGNALAAEALMIAGLYTGEDRWHEMSRSALEAVAVLLERHPSMVAHHLSILHSSSQTKELAIVGPEWGDLAKVYWSEFRPEVALAATAEGSDRVPLLSGRPATAETRAFVCKGFACDLPTGRADELASQLG